MKQMKRLMLMLLIGALSAACSGAAFARGTKNETRTPIDTVYLQVTSQVREGDDRGYLVATEGGGLCTVGNLEWSGMSGDGWKIGDKPRVKIYLHAKSGYYFNKTNGKGKVTVSGAQFTTAKIGDNKETLIVTVELKPVSGRHQPPDFAQWAGYPYGLAQWEAVAGIDAYELILYRDGNMVTGIEKVVGSTFDFFPYMAQSGDYRYRVRGIPKDSVQAEYITPTDWTLSESQNISNDETPSGWYDWNKSTLGQNKPVSGWQKNAEGWWYQEADGYPADTWKQIDGKWYLFDYRGYMLTGWQNREGKWYYLSDNGDMQTGWLQDQRQWYYLGADGGVLTGWNTIDGKTYFMNDQCAILYGWWVIDGKWYYFDTNTGSLVRDAWVDGYYINSDGIWTG